MAYQPSFCERGQVQTGHAQVTVRHPTVRSRLRLLIAPLLAWAICVTGLFGLRGIAHAQSGGVGYVYDSLGRLIAAYDPSGNAAVYKYDAVGNLLSITSEGANQFSGFDTSSNSGLPGATITIYGTDFCSNPSVTFNGIAATVESATATQIVVVVPSNATTGTVVVTCGSNQANLGTFTISNGAPTISGFSPNLGAAGTAVTINGSNFAVGSGGIGIGSGPCSGGDSPSPNSVQFGVTGASGSVASTTAICTNVPANASTGHVSVTTTNGQAISTGYFFVPPPSSSIGPTGSIIIGGPSVTVSIATAGKQGLLAFDGSAGQQISLNAKHSSFSNTAIYLIPPGGATANAIASLTFARGFGTVSNITLPDDGTYVVFVDPTSGDTGSVQIQLADLTDLSESVASDSYSTAVLADMPMAYWRLDESGPGSAADAVPAIAYQTSGPTVPDTAVSLNGSSSYVSTAKQISNPAALSVEIWFKTKTSNGGSLMSFGNSQSGASANLARVLYMDNSGHLHFGIYNGSAYESASSTAAFNDGQWHYAVGTYDGSNNLVIYVDGQNVGSASNVGTAQAYNGYWRLGYDNLVSTWPSAPNSNYFHGSIGEAAVYSSGLNSAQVSGHYAARSGGSYDNTIMADSPAFYWKLNESGDVELADSSAAGQNPGIAEGLANDNGVYWGTVTYGQAGMIATDNCVFVDGSTGFVSTPLSINNPEPFSVEVWILTHTTSGGPVISFGDQAAGSTTNVDRVLYMNDNGHFQFAIHSGSSYVNAWSPVVSNDGNWHYVVGTYDGSTLKLYVDNVDVATTTNAGAPQNFAGFWRLGNGELSAGSWPTPPSSNFFYGHIDEPAVYDYALTASQISNHYHASGR